MQQKEWRRYQVLELSSKGYSQSEIARALQIDRSIISRDSSYLREQSKQNIRKYIDERLPEEYEKCLVGISSILKEAWNTVNNPEDKKDKLHALSLAKDCYSMKLELLTNATIIEDALKFVSANKDKVKFKDNNKPLKFDDITPEETFKKINTVF
jgi:predicted transcriptional regulator